MSTDSKNTANNTKSSTADASQEETKNMMDTNIYNFTYHTTSDINGGVIQEKENILLGGNMEDILEKYRLFLGMKYRKTNSQTVYYNSAEQFLTYVKEITREEIQRYLIHLNQNYKPNTVTTRIVGLNRFLEHHGRKDLRVPTPDWKPIRRDTITKDQIIQLIDHARHNYRYMDYLILLMIRDLDCRNHEILKTQWSWIHGDKIYFQDCKTGDTIGRLTPELHEALNHWREHTPYPKKPYVFFIPYGACKGQPIGKTGLYIRTLVNKISLEVIGRRLNPQDLRASVITAEYTAYVNPKIIQLKARHRSEQTTMRYNHVDEELVAEYMGDGTIFTDNKKPILRPQQETVRKIDSKRGCINRFSIIPGTLITEEEDNTNFSFSITFFIEEEYGYMTGSMKHDDLLLGWSKPLKKEVLH